MNIKKITALKNKRKLTVLTAYDYPTAVILDRAGMDIILVGDSLANVVLGLESTTQVGITEILHHTKAVARGVKNALLVADMPYSAYQLNPQDSVKNARRLIKEGGCQAVKLEWFNACPKITKKIIKAGIPVMGHIGLTPQTADQLGGFKVQGKDAQTAQKLIDQALILEKAGCFAIVLECVPDKISAMITRKLSIPTIGIGAGIHCDGQVLVINDMLGFFDRYTPKFVKKYVDLSKIILKAATKFKNDILAQKFPTAKHSFTIKKEELSKLKNCS